MGSRFAVVYWLAGAIIAAHVARLGLPLEQQLALYDRFAVVPGRFEEVGVGLLAPMLGHVFLHGFVGPGSFLIGLLHLGMNMLVFMQVAPLLAARLEQDEPGGLKFLGVFFGSAIAAALTFVALNPDARGGAVGASGAVCGIYAAYLLASRRSWREAVRDRQVMLAGFWFLAINVGLAGFAAQAGIPIAWEAHLGGFIGGAALYPMLAPRLRPVRGPWG